MYASGYGLRNNRHKHHRSQQSSCNPESATHLPRLEIALDELSECVGGESAEDVAIRKEILASLNRFLGTLKETERSVFLCRYWYLDSTEEIAEKSGFSVSKVKSMLFRIRKRLYAQLQEEGLA